MTFIEKSVALSDRSGISSAAPIQHMLVQAGFAIECRGENLVVVFLDLRSLRAWRKSQERTIDPLRVSDG
jgi:hypothetical protein